MRRNIEMEISKCLSSGASGAIVVVARCKLQAIYFRPQNVGTLYDFWWCVYASLCLDGRTSSLRGSCAAGAAAITEAAAAAAAAAPAASASAAAVSAAAVHSTAVLL